MFGQEENLRRSLVEIDGRTEADKWAYEQLMKQSKYYNM